MAPASKLRENVLEVLKREGYIRAWRTEELRPGVRFIEIELKYSEGEPAIKEITRVSKPGRRVYSKITELPRIYNGLGISILSTPRGVMSDERGPRCQCWRRSPLPRVLTGANRMSRVGKYPVPVPAGVTVALAGRTLTAKGKLGELKLDLTDDVDVEIKATEVAVSPAAHGSSLAHHVGHDAQPDQPHGARACRPAS